MRCIALFAVFLMISLLPSFSHAVICGPGHPSDGETLRIPAADYSDSPTSRQTVDEYADTHQMKRDVAEQKFAPTGKLSCANGSLSANLIGKGDLLLTADHPFIDRVTCKKRANPKGCTFTVEGQKPVRVTARLQSGSICPVKNGDWNTDFAVLKLEKVVPGVTPYRVKRQEAKRFLTPQQLVVVADHSIDFTRVNPQTNEVTHPKHVQDCSSDEPYPQYDPIAFGSRCGSAPGASGGGVLERDLSTPTLLGLVVASPESEAELNHERATGQPVVKKSDTESWSTIQIAITGRLLRAIDEASR